MFAISFSCLWGEKANICILVLPVAGIGSSWFLHHNFDKYEKTLKRESESCFCVIFWKTGDEPSGTERQVGRNNEKFLCKKLIVVKLKNKSVVKAP